jgi:hypothetical protein
MNRMMNNTEASVNSVARNISWEGGVSPSSVGGKAGSKGQRSRNVSWEGGVIAPGTKGK